MKVTEMSSRLKIAEKKDAKQVTVRELIEQLQAIIKEHPEAADAPVESQGCDCDGPASGADLYTGYAGALVIVGRT